MFVIPCMILEQSSETCSDDTEKCKRSSLSSYVGVLSSLRAPRKDCRGLQPDRLKLEPSVPTIRPL